MSLEVIHAAIGVSITAILAICGEIIFRGR
jgi:hypothetical protein